MYSAFIVDLPSEMEEAHYIVPVLILLLVLYVNYYLFGIPHYIIGSHAFGKALLLLSFILAVTYFSFVPCIYFCMYNNFVTFCICTLVYASTAFQGNTVFLTN